MKCQNMNCTYFGESCSPLWEKGEVMSREVLWSIATVNENIRNGRSILRSPTGVKGQGHKRVKRLNCDRADIWLYELGEAKQLKNMFLFENILSFYSLSTYMYCSTVLAIQPDTYLPQTVAVHGIPLLYKSLMQATAISGSSVQTTVMSGQWPFRGQNDWK